METTKVITVNEIGQRTGNPYTGKFTIKTILTRRDNFIADERRRFILGSNPNGAMPSLQGEALMLGLLSVRIIESPKWWKESDSGLDIEDENIIGILYKLSEEAAIEVEKEIKDNAKKSLETLAKATAPTKRINTQEE